MLTRIISTIVVALVLTATGPANAVTNGQPDGNNHPWVGVMIQPIQSMPGFVSVCTGAALSATKFLTAAHCADPTMPVFVSYKSAPPFSLAADFTQGTFYIDPNWCIECEPGLPGFDTHDVAVVILSAPNNAANGRRYHRLRSARFHSRRRSAWTGFSFHALLRAEPAYSKQ